MKNSNSFSIFLKSMLYTAAAHHQRMAGDLEIGGHLLISLGYEILEFHGCPLLFWFRDE